MLQVMTWCQNLCVGQKANATSECLKELVKRTEQIGEALILEIQIKKKLENQDSDED
jgi:hypothetical protein